MNRKIITASAAPATGAAAPAEDYGRGEMIALLDAAAQVDGSRTMAAAMHLLTGAGLPGQPAFARHVDIEDGRLGDPGLTRVTCAWVRERDALLADRDAFSNEQQLTLVTLAASYAEEGGRSACTTPSATPPPGPAPGTAQRIIEATAIAAGFDLATIKAGKPQAPA